MPLISVMNSDSNEESRGVVVQDLATKLSDLRKDKLSGFMGDGDQFLTREGAPVHDETAATVEDMVKPDDLTIKFKKKAPLAGPLTIQLMKGEKGSLLKFEGDKSLDEFRKHLKTQNLIEDADRFQTKPNVTVSPENEAILKVTDAVDAAGAVKLVKASPTRNITVVKGSKSTPYNAVEDSEGLATFRARLLKDKVITASDVFMAGSAELPRDPPPTYTVSQALTDKNILTIKDAPIVGPATPTVNLPQMTKGEWAHSVNYGSGPGTLPTPPKFAGTVQTGKEDRWEALTTEEKRYVFSVNQLGRSIVIPKAGVLDSQNKEHVTKPLTKADDLAVWITPYDQQTQKTEPGANEPQIKLESSFLVTFSQTVQQLRKRGATTASASFGAKGIAVKGEFTSAYEETRETDRSTVYMTQLLYKPAIELFFREGDIGATDQFTKAITEAVYLQAASSDPCPTRTRYNAILSALNQYGHFIPTRFVLGGACVVEEVRSVDKNATIDEKSISFSTGIEAEIKGVKAGISAGNSSALKDSWSKLDQRQAVTTTVLGGDTGSVSPENPSPWLSSLRMCNNWSVIEYSELEPTIRYLKTDLLRGCLAVIKLHWADPGTQDKTALNMLDYANLAEATLLAAEKPGGQHFLWSN
jgi:hypothetical protein